MSNGRTLMGWALLLVSLVASGCDSTGGNSSPAGSQGGPCHPNGTCSTGLECQNGQCLSPGIAQDDVPIQDGDVPPASWDLPLPDLPGDQAPGDACSPGAAICDGNVSRTCAPSGQEWTSWNCTLDGLDCQDGECRSKPVACVKVRPIEVRTSQPVPASVAVVFAVDDCSGAPVIGLDRSRFLVLEDNKRISPSESSATSLVRDAEIYVSLVIDNSPSVKAAGALPQAVGAARKYVEQVMGSPSVHAGVWFFSKKLTSRQDYTTDKATVLAALDDLLTDDSGSNTTNLYGSLMDILDVSARFQQQRRDAMAGGITTLGQIVLFTDGSDLAALKSLDDAKAALERTTDDVLAIALGGEIEPDVIQVIGKDGWFIAQTAADLQTRFDDAANRTKGLQKRIYIQGYCSPKLAGEHNLTIQVVDGEKVLGSSPPVSFDARDFGIPGMACSEATFEQACDGKKCGGLLCGDCGPGTCGASSFQCQCPTRFAGDHCQDCSPHFAGESCNACSEAFTGPECNGCANPLFAGAECDQCSSPRKAPPDCSACLPRFTGPDCTGCADSRFAGENCDQCATPGFATPDCTSCKPGLGGSACDRCANAHQAFPGCTVCLPRFTGASCDQCAKEGFATPDCTSCKPGLGGTSCDQCANAHMAFPGCTACLPRFTGASCNECAASWLTGADCDEIETVTVPGGMFMQGCNAAVDADCDSSEKPYHEVVVPTFEIDVVEVTVSSYRDCVSGGACTAPGTGYNCNWGSSYFDDFPVNCISWQQARAFCEFAGKRLCAESEWEKASRGTDGRKYPWGNQAATCELAVLEEGVDGCGTNSTMAVGSRPGGASPYGALDMSGNVREWVEDDWHLNYTGAPTDGSAWADSPRASVRVHRGGSFTAGGNDLRSSNRVGGGTEGYDVSIGARCCRSAEP